jgi:hypothetical protein
MLSTTLRQTRLYFDSVKPKRKTEETNTYFDSTFDTQHDQLLQRSITVLIGMKQQ